MKLRRKIIDRFLQSGQPASVQDLADSFDLSIEELIRALDTSERLEDLGSLRIEDAELLIEFYGEQLLFAEEVVKSVKDFRAVRRRLDKIEEKAKKN